MVPIHKIKMKKYLFKYVRLKIFLFLIGITFLLTGCIAELGLEAGVAEELAVAETAGELAGAEAIIETEVAMGEAAEVGTVAEEASLLRNSLARNSVGEIAVSDIESMNTLLGRIKLGRVIGESPKLYIEGKSSAFAELYPESGKFRMFKSNNYYSFPDNIFSVDGESVRVRSSTEISPNNIITTLNDGKLVVKLAEKDGWYQIKCVEDSKVYLGWINSLYALPVVALLNKEKKESTFKHPDGNKIKADLIGKSIPGWNFNSLSDFQDVQIEDEAIENGYLVQTVDLKLKDSYNSNLYDSQIKVAYCNTTNNNWVLSNVTSKSFSKAPSINQSNNNTKGYIDKNQTFTSKIIISTKIRGPFTIKNNVSCVINPNGAIVGNLILNKDALLTIYGMITGYVYNYGGKIINKNSDPLRVIEVRTRETKGTQQLNQIEIPHSKRIY